MGVKYQAVIWNRQKKVYDRTLLAGVVLYLGAFVALGFVVHPNATFETLLIRGLATAAFLLLHLILSIGPLCRLSPRFLPLLYNRRHMGVTMFALAAGHGGFSLFQFHMLGDLNPLVSVLVGNSRLDSLAQFPFQPLGLLALLILFLMAATSHDFWLANLSAPVWKSLHMLVYVAYGLIVLHVAFGVLQAETSPWLAGLTGVGLVWVAGVHLAAGWRERGGDREVAPADDGWLDAGPVDTIRENRARIVCGSGERIAVFRYGGKVSAVSNVCQHQNGPLGEGRIVDGCITCPWHGYQYLPESGRSPEPFNEKVPTFNVRVVDGRVWIDPRPNAAGTPVEPAIVGGEG
jgi:nitrite reductase/ring-hydroxylating ferredoxin subunit/DMSO/TMAO reductase YedYZ heme-binding membrane subunit